MTLPDDNFNNYNVYEQVCDYIVPIYKNIKYLYCATVYMYILTLWSVFNVYYINMKLLFLNFLCYILLLVYQINFFNKTFHITLSRIEIIINFLFISIIIKVYKI